MIRAMLAALLLPLLLLAGCQSPGPAAPQTAPAAARTPLDAIAEDYVRLTLVIGEREAGYVDAYYGPAEWAAAAKRDARNPAALAEAVAALAARVDAVDEATLDPLQLRRARFLRAQLTAAATRLRMMQGERLSFRDESLGLFGATPELRPLTDYDRVLERIAALVPGEGPLAARVEAFQDRYTIAPERLKPVFDAAIAACRERTLRHIDLPPSERFTMAFVTDKPWSGYNYYQGDFESLIEINTDLPIRIGRAVDLGCHEGYPGHHVLNTLLEQRLTKERGWVEFSVYPLYSPQSLIAEGSANYGIELAFPGRERLEFERTTLYPLAGLDPASAQAFYDLQQALGALSGARFTIAQQYLDGEIDRETAVALAQKYQLVSEERARQSISFNDTYRSYVINYGLGQQMVRAYVEAAGRDPIYRWAAMEKVLSEPTLPSDLAVK